MPHFSQRSYERLKTCHPDLIRLFETVVRGFDCTVLEGHRGEQAQNDAYDKGYSKLRYPDSKHNKTPSLAVDVAPYPVDWNDRERFYFFAGYVKGVAEELDITIRWGGDWDSDTHVHDQTFFDLPHFELK
jgi:peptidoglycan L-alanyl-D-glutamate endopeptidase CwlK